jgi:hypothetical protein
MSITQLTVENFTHVHMIFLTGNGLMNKILMDWYKVTKDCILNVLKDKTVRVIYVKSYRFWYLLWIVG